MQLMLVYTSSDWARKRSFLLFPVVSELVVAALCDLMMKAIAYKNANHRLQYHCAATAQSLRKGRISLFLLVDYS